MPAKEIVKRAIEFTNPSRLPLHYCNRDLEHSDTCTLSFAPASGFAPSHNGETEWGYIWRQLDDTMGQPENPPIREAEDAFTYIPPDPKAPGRLEHVPALLASERDRFTRFALGISGFNQATFLRGFDTFLMDLYTDPAAAERVLDIIFSFENEMIAQIADHPFDAVALWDDWGTQNGLLISPDLWRKVFRPRYADQFAHIHASGKKIWLHTCGDVSSIIGDFIDIGVDVLELLQPDVMGIDNLARAFGGKVCFCCSVDHQQRAISGTKDEIFAYAETLVQKLGDFNGGLIGYIEDYACLGMDEQHYQWICEAFQKVSGGRFAEK